MMFIVLCALVALAKATVEYQSPYYVSTGRSQQYRTQDASGSYRFGYDESHPSGGTFRDETGDAWGNKYGSYGLREADGRYRVVNYVADANGFRAEIKSNEPGVAPKDPAATTIKTTHEVEPVHQKPVFEPVQQKPVFEPVQQKPVFEPVSQKTVFQPVQQKPILYAAPVTAPLAVHHSYNPEYPLLYHNYHNPYYVPYNTYKGTPFRSYSTYYKGTPFSKKGAPLVSRQGYYIYP